MEFPVSVYGQCLLVLFVDVKCNNLSALVFLPCLFPPPSFLPSRLNHLTSLSLSLSERSSSPLIILVCLCWTCFSVPLSLLYLWAQNWPWCKLMSSLSTRTSRSFFASLLSSYLLLNPYWCMELFLPRWKIWHFPLNIRWFLMAHPVSGAPNGSAPLECMNHSCCLYSLQTYTLPHCIAHYWRS